MSFSNFHRLLFVWPLHFYRMGMEAEQREDARELHLRSTGTDIYIRHTMQYIYPAYAIHSNCFCCFPPPKAKASINRSDDYSIPYVCFLLHQTSTWKKSYIYLRKSISIQMGSKYSYSFCVQVDFVIHFYILPYRPLNFGFYKSQCAV